MKQKLIIGWLYPTLMSTYGDRGNIIVLTKRLKWRRIEVEVKQLEPGFKASELKECDLLFMGGAQDRQQKIVSEDLATDKVQTLRYLIEDKIPGLYICGAYQFLGKYYKEADGTIISGLEIFDLHTQNPGENQKRLIGNIVFEPDRLILNTQLVGFENHGGRTYLGKNIKPFGKVLKGYGNNGKDGTEGARYKNSFGTYLHGPILPKNPLFADYLIQKALEKKYNTEVELKELDDTFEHQANEVIVKRLGIRV